MSESLYQRLVSLFFGFVLLVISTLAAMFIFLLSWFVKTEFLLYAFLGAIFCIGIYGCLYFLQIRDFKDNIGLYIPKTQNPIEPLELEGLDDLSLRVCLWYRNGASLEKIGESLGLAHSTTVRRKLQDGLDILLKFYDEHKELKQ